MGFKTRFRNTKDEWMSAFGFRDGRPETWVRSPGIKSLELAYETDPAVIEEIVPPPIKFVGRDTGLVSISFVQKFGRELLASPAARHFRTVIESYLLVGPCECKGATGFYSPAMWAQYDEPLMSGREIHGCNKKIAQFHFERRKDRVFASATRLDVKFLEIKCRLTGKRNADVTNYSKETKREQRYTFLVKVIPSTRDGDLEVCKVLKMESEPKPGETYEVALDSIEVKLEDSAFDPLADIPVKKVVSSTYGEDGEVAIHAHELAECDPEIVKEYILNRYR